MRWWEIALSSVYFDLWIHGAAPLAWPWQFNGPVFLLIQHFAVYLGVDLT